MRQHTAKSSFVYVLLAIFILTFSTAVFAEIEDTIEKSFSVKPGGTLTIDTKRGSIEVAGSSGNTVEVKVIREVKTSSRDSAQEILDKFPVTFEHRGDSVFITADTTEKNNLKKFWNDLTKKLNVRFIVTVPEVYHVDLRTSGGSIQVKSLEGRILAKTSGGGLTFDHIVGDIRGDTSGGSIKIGDVDGDVQVDTSGGGITIDRARGQVDAHTSGGSITVNEVMGTIQAKTSGGSIKAYISRQPESSCRLTTSGGSVSVTMAEDTKVDLDAQTSGGSVKTEFPLTIQGELKRTAVKAKINGGGPELYLRTSGGSIYIKKK